MPCPSSPKLGALLLTALLTACGGGDDESDGDLQASSATRVASCGRQAGPLRIMPLGDSITEAEAGHNSYRRVLWQRLNAASCSVDLVGSKRGVSSGYRNSPSTPAPDPDFDQDHEAHWDYRVDQILPFLATRISNTRPDVVLIHLGTNDVLGGQSAAGITEELGAVIDTIRSAKADTYILLAKIIPASPNPAGTAALNRRIDALAALKNHPASPVAVVDQAAGYSLADNYDGVHPNAVGEAKLGNKWADALLAWRQR